MADAAELPADLQDLLLEDTNIVDANHVLSQQRQIKKAYKLECARKKAGFVLECVIFCVHNNFSVRLRSSFAEKERERGGEGESERVRERGREGERAGW